MKHIMPLITLLAIVLVVIILALGITILLIDPAAAHASYDCYHNKYGQWVCK